MYRKSNGVCMKRKYACILVEQMRTLMCMNMNINASTVLYSMDKSERRFDWQARSATVQYIGRAGMRTCDTYSEMHTRQVHTGGWIQAGGADVTDAWSVVRSAVAAHTSWLACHSCHTTQAPVLCYHVPVGPTFHLRLPLDVCGSPRLPVWHHFLCRRREVCARTVETRRVQKNRMKFVQDGWLGPLKFTHTHIHHTVQVLSAGQCQCDGRLKFRTVCPENTGVTHNDRGCHATPASIVVIMMTAVNGVIRNVSRRHIRACPQITDSQNRPVVSVLHPEAHRGVRKARDSHIVQKAARLCFFVLFCLI